MTTQFWAALDKPTQIENLRQAAQIADSVDCLKVNSDAIDEQGMEAVVTPFKEFGIPLFLDLKAYGGGRTIGQRIKRAAELGVDYVNVSVFAGSQIVRALKEVEGLPIRVLGHTVLSHENEAFCQDFFRRSKADTAHFLTERVFGYGCFGAIMPGNSLPAISDVTGFKACPSIRTPWGPVGNDQDDPITHVQAVEFGAGAIILGTPWSAYPEADGGPKVAARRIKEELLEAWDATLRV